MKKLLFLVSMIPLLIGACERVDDNDSVIPDTIIINPVDTIHGLEDTVEVPLNPQNPSVGGFDIYGASNAIFSVAENTTIHFSKGNLQYNKTNRTFRFAKKQYDYIGAHYSSVSAGWIDLFGYGSFDWNGRIANGGNENCEWRVLTNGEWYYLIYNRSDASNKYGSANVNGNCGLIILPDTWCTPLGLVFNSGMNGYGSNNKYTLDEWYKMENAGAVFLPASGQWHNSNLYGIGSFGYYWSSSYVYENDANSIYYWHFTSQSLNNTFAVHDYGCSIRLVHE